MWEVVKIRERNTIVGGIGLSVYDFIYLYNAGCVSSGENHNKITI